MRSQELPPISDLHCHILPAVDDGASDLEMSRALLEREAEQRVGQILFTPHFYGDRMTLPDFLERRRHAAELVGPICQELGISYACGAEVRMVPELMDLDPEKELRSLAMADTGFFLLEWPFYGFPIWGDEVVNRVWDAGRTPIFAHIERYDFFFHAPERLETYLEDGVLCQLNASTLLEKQTQRHALRLIKNGSVQLIASDAHNLKGRPPLLEEAYRVVERRLGEKSVNRLRENADAVFHGAF